MTQSTRRDQEPEEKEASALISPADSFRVFFFGRIIIYLGKISSAQKQTSNP
jgi:hypothetical protein